MLEKCSFGRTGHRSTRILFGAAALGGMRQDRADRVLELLLEHGVNHIDTAADYGDSELRVGSWMAEHRPAFFLATKTAQRDAAGARESLHRSLERLRVDSVDLIQLHNLVDENEWERALGAGGALEALVAARQEGLVRFIGVTGHGTRVASMHRRSLERFDFDSVLLPYNYAMISQPGYAADFGALLETCRSRNVAVQTIKAVARLREPEAVGRAVRFVMAREGLFLNSSSDATLLPAILGAAGEPRGEPGPAEAELRADVELYGVEPLFVPGGPQGI